MGKKTGLITLLFLFFFLNGFSQPVADFTADVTEGCESIIVNFTDLSTGATTWHWNFGNGNSSSSQNPTAIYNNGGSTDLVFDVTLIVSNGSISDTLVMEDFITVFALPTAYFQATTDTAGCTPLVVSFQDQSTPAESPIVTWEWTLGTGATSSVQHPTQTYVTPGYYTVLLKVTDDNGCISNYSINNYIYVSDIPEAGFTVNSTADCSAPLTVEFMDTSHTGTGQQIDYLWYFGDGDTSALQNPQHTYQNNGTYDVALVVSNEFGCTDSVMFEEYIQIVPINVSFSPSVNPGCPYIPVTFTVTTTNATEF
ncbi:MAG: PKD domain-containing protein, partial [Bacteroidetes bacterium]|nr:PKD domain-containing protein [Bacteroidota bacterium]